MPPQPGERFGRYELMSRLGRGGMAETWRARLMGEAGVTKPVLIKRILPQYADDEAFTSMFISEARISATLSHSNIAQVYDFGRVDDEYFLAMEFVDGQPLDRLMQRAQKEGFRSIPVPLAAFIGIEMCRGLHYAHTRGDERGKLLGIVHRDISPDNVLVSYEGQVKIVDFGIAKARELRSVTTAPGLVKGKYLFFSPEQARGEEVDARTDVWATGIVLYEMLCGQLPAQGPEHLVRPKLMNGRFPRPREHNPDVPEELEAILLKALAVRRADRYHSCHALEQMLAGFLRSIEPRFSAMTLAHFAQELFRKELTTAGRRVQVPTAFLERFALWRDDGRKTDPLSTPTVLLEPAAAAAPAQPEAPGPSRKPLLAAAGIGAGVSLLAVATAILGFGVGLGEPKQAPVAPSRPSPALQTGPTAPAPTTVEQQEATRQATAATVLLFHDAYSNAESLARQCIQAHPQHARCHWVLGLALQSQGRLDEAVTTYGAFLRVNGDSQDRSEALKYLGEPMPHDPSAARALAAKDSGIPAWITQMKKLLRQSQPFLAVSLARKCLAVDAEQAECHLLAGAGYGGMFESELGARHYKRFLELAPDHPMAPSIRKALENFAQHKELPPVP